MNDYLRWGLAFRSPINQTLILNVEERRPRDILEELRQTDPDGHALLTEHIVLPEAEEK